MENKIKTINTGSRLLYLDMIKAVSVIGVIVLHVTAANWMKIDVHSADFAVETVYNGISRSCVPLFVMANGAVFLDREISLKVLYKKYILRLVIAYFAWSIIYAVVRFWGKFEINAFLSDVIKGHYHLWFIPMIIGLYMIVPFLRKVVQDRRLAEYFIILALIFGCTLPALAERIGLVNELYSNTLKQLIDNAAVKFVLGYSPYFVLGYLLNKTEISKKAEIIIYSFGAAGFIITPLATVISSRRYDVADKFFLGNLSLNVLACAVAVFVFTKQHSGYLKGGTKLSNLIVRLSVYSFGIYLIHPLIVDNLNYKYGITPSSFCAAFSVPLLVIGIYIVSAAVTALLNKIPFINKYLV